MSKTEEYRQALHTLKNWDSFLMENSGLPGPRGNLELAHVVADEGDLKRFNHFLSCHAEENTPEVFIVFCGLLGLGRLAATQPELFSRLREYASDPRWRIREAAATGLQLTGDQDMDLLIRQMKKWVKGSWYEKRAAAAALAEPRLLKQPKHAKQVLHILDGITSSIERDSETREESFKVLRQAMGYCWSVAVAALPEVGKTMMENWLETEDENIRWIMMENLKKKRLTKMDAAWVKRSTKVLD